MNKPVFFIVGVAKVGPTSLVGYLGQHPDVLFPKITEPKYFSLDENIFPPHARGSTLADSRLVKSMAEYAAPFTQGVRCTARGEPSVDYLFFYVAEEIRKDIRDANIILVLRNPVDRAHLAYMHYVRDGLKI